MEEEKTLFFWLERWVGRDKKPAVLEEGKGAEDGDGDEITVDAKDHLVHADVEHGLGEDVVAAVGHLHQRHAQVRPQHLVPSR